MQIFAKSIDDFKTDRKDIAPPLPPYLQLVPIAFYLSILGTVIFNALFLALYSQAGQAKQNYLRQDKQLLADLDSTKKDRQNLELEAKKATDMATWVDASRPLQPLVVEIARSMGEDANLMELRLDRAAENASQIKLSLRLQTDNAKQLDQTLQTIADNRFRSFSPQQSMVKGEVEYKATLFWQDSNREPASVK